MKYIRKKLLFLIRPEWRDHKIVHKRGHVIRLIVMAIHHNRTLIANFNAETATDTGRLIHYGHLAVIALNSRVSHGDAIKRAYVHTPDTSGAILLKNKCLGHLFVLNIRDAAATFILNRLHGTVFPAYSAIDAKSGRDDVYLPPLTLKALCRHGDPTVALNRTRGAHRQAGITSNTIVKNKMWHPVFKFLFKRAGITWREAPRHQTKVLDQLSHISKFRLNCQANEGSGIHRSLPGDLPHPPILE